MIIWPLCYVFLLLQRAFFPLAYPVLVASAISKARYSQYVTRRDIPIVRIAGSDAHRVPFYVRPIFFHRVIHECDQTRQRPGHPYIPPPQGMGILGLVRGTSSFLNSMSHLKEPNGGWLGGCVALRNQSSTVDLSRNHVSMEQDGRRLNHNWVERTY